MSARAVALWCAIVVAIGAATAYTVDCNQEYTDCDTELSKLASEDDDLPALKATVPETTTKSPNVTLTPPTNLPKTEPNNINKIASVEHQTDELKPKPRHLNLNVNELQNFANALHNETHKNSKKITDLSDVNLDDDDEEPPRMVGQHHHRDISDKFYTNLQAPFHTITSGRGSDEMEMCRENDVNYKIGEKIERGCEETCECTPGGVFECSPRCKLPYIRRGRRLNDPLCFESPVDECCSIIACATGNGETKAAKIDQCKYGNDTYPVGSKWYIGCEQSCVCEPNSVVTCKPRCKPLPPSDKCINVQDPNDACCEVQVCDVSQDVHELTQLHDNTTSSTTSTTAMPSPQFEGYEEGRSSYRPLVLAEPIGSIKVLQNNSVQVNLMHMNDSKDPIHLLLSDDGGKTYDDVELKYSNLILHLEGGKDYILKTKETGTKFNFTITASDESPNAGFIEPVEDDSNHSKAGCWEEGNFYEVGQEYRIGCSELCECVAPNQPECVALVCPNHVGLEIMSKFCVKWAPNPPAQPPNCCPRSARCLSDGTCYYNGVPVPNWSEVPLSLTGCEQRCFCENGDLDCQEVCSPLAPVPPQTLRCPPMHRPAAVNISDEDCCKQWGCVPNGTPKGSTYSMSILNDSKMAVTTFAPFLPTVTTPVLPTPPLVTEAIDHNLHSSFHYFPKFTGPVTPASETHSVKNSLRPKFMPGDNITVFTLEDIDAPFKTIHPEPPLVDKNHYWLHHDNPDFPKATHSTFTHASHSHVEKHVNFALADKNPYQPRILHVPSQNKNLLNVHDDAVKKLAVPSSADLNYFMPNPKEKVASTNAYYQLFPEPSPIGRIKSNPAFFKPFNNKSDYILTKSNLAPSKSILDHTSKDYSMHNSRGKHVTVLKSKDLQSNTNDALWSHATKTHVLTKQPNLYETVLNAVKMSKAGTTPIPYPNLSGMRQQNRYSTLDFDHIINQMEIQSKVNLGRSTNKDPNVYTAAHATSNTEFPSHKPQHPSFLPTIPPGHNFPNEDSPDYEQSNIHRLPTEPGLPGLPPGLQVVPSFGEMNKKLSVISIEADSPTSIRMLLGLPPVLVGLKGSVDLRYTDTADEDMSNWYSQVFAPADEVLTTPRLEFRLTGLKPSTTYKVRGKLYLHNLPVSPESETFSVLTPAVAVTVPMEEKRRQIDSKLTVTEVNDTVAHVSWRHFADDELQFIDGIQVRYRPVGTPIYSMTELLHHSRSAAELLDLHPGTRYEASLVLIPPPRSTTELFDTNAVQFITQPYIDPYNWTVSIEIRSIGAQAAELAWAGVPSPAERWVRVYRAAHACGEHTNAREQDLFKLASRDQPQSVTITGLEPDTRCRVWLELFLTNGKVKTSNVLEINTKSLDSDNPIDNEIEASSQSVGARARPSGDYYTALVGVGVVAALGALTSLLLLLVVLRRHRPHSVSITPVPTAPRESSLPPYDNPAYKLELQQETMDI